MEDAKALWIKLLADADEEINKKAGVRGRFKVGEAAPMDVALTGRNGEHTTMGALLNESRHAAGLLLVVASKPPSVVQSRQPPEGGDPVGTVGTYAQPLAAGLPASRAVVGSPTP